MDVKIEGLKEIEAALAELPRSLGKSVLTRIVKQSLPPMRDTAAALAPKDTGALEASFTISKSLSRAEGKADVELAMGPSKQGYPQALPEEFGSPNNPPRGFMRAAWDMHHRALLDGIGKQLGDAVAAAAKRLKVRNLLK